jgi:hypothetical protein
VIAVLEPSTSGLDVRNGHTFSGSHCGRRSETNGGADV